MELTTDGISVVSGVVSVVSLNEKEGQSSEVPFEYKRKAPSESNDDDRHVSVIGDVSGFAVSAVSAVILPDINEMELTASDISPVSVAVSAVNRHQIFLNRRSK